MLKFILFFFLHNLMVCISEYKKYKLIAVVQFDKVMDLPIYIYEKNYFRENCAPISVCLSVSCYFFLQYGRSRKYSIKFFWSLLKNVIKIVCIKIFNIGEKYYFLIRFFSGIFRKQLGIFRNLREQREFSVILNKF
jgi:hypothetical protein